MRADVYNAEPRLSASEAKTARLSRKNSLRVRKISDKKIEVVGIDSLCTEPVPLFEARVETVGEFLLLEDNISEGDIRDSIGQWGIPLLSYMSMLLALLTREMGIGPILMRPAIEYSEDPNPTPRDEGEIT